MNQTVLLWFKGLLAAFIGGAANAVTAIIIDPHAFNFGEQWKKTAGFALVSGIVSAALYLKKSPLPGVKETLSVLLVCALLLPMMACGGDGKRAAQAVYDTSVSLNATVKVISRLHDAGFIEQADYVAMLQASREVVIAHEEVRQQIAAVGQITPGNKGAILAYLDGLTAALSRLQEQGILHIKSDEGLASFNLAIASARTAISIIRIFTAAVDKPVKVALKPVPAI